MSNKNAVNNKAQELLTIVIETLVGKTFEVKISPQDRVKSIKSKIQKVEGIPVSHQHLLHNFKELQDSLCVTDPSVGLHDRATVKLVVAMRGGPISLVHQAVPLNKSFLKNLVKFNCEDWLEDLPPGCKMAILVLRVGDQLNLLHVVDNGDDSSDSSSSDKNTLSLESLKGEIEKTLEENCVTMDKVCDLKERLGKLSLQRKSLKADGESEEGSSNSLHNNSLQLNKPGTSMKLPSIGQQVPSEKFKTRSEFSQVPILPDIIPQSFKSTSRDLEFVSLDKETASAQICDTIRPKTCPGSLTESQFYKVFSEGECQNSLQISQPHFRSCVSACASKLHHEWGGGKGLLQSLDILPPITGVPDILTNRREIPDDEATNSQTTTVPSIEKLNLHHRNLSSAVKFQQNLRRESNPSLNRSESFLSRNEASNSDFFSDDVYNTSANSSDLFPKATRGPTTLMSLTDSPYCDILNNKTKISVVEPIPNSKKINFDKKSRLRCSECKKRLSLTSTFECRCGFVFCSYHRYSETHHCTFDFKKESRKLLEQANPAVVAPKLPKI